MTCFLDKLNEATGLDRDGIDRLISVMEIGDELRRALKKERPARGGIGS